MHGDWITFLGVVLVLTVTPGADMAIVSRRVLTDGWHAVWPTLLGIYSGICVHVTLCIAGLSLVIARSHVAFTAIRVAGAAYLVLLGVQALLESRRARTAAGSARDAAGAEHIPVAARRWSQRRRWYVQGLLTNVLNVKIALFYIAFLPQFAHPGPGFAWHALGLAAIQVAIGFTWLVTWAALVRRAGDASRRPRMKQLMERATGIALVAFGMRLAVG